MSANLDLVRSIYADWERGDFSRADWADPQIEYVHPDGPSPGSWRGLAEMGAAFRDWLSAWEDWTAEAEAYRELDDERVLVVTTSSGRGKRSGLGAGQYEHGANLFYIHDGKVRRLVTYWYLDRALADLGPEAEAVSRERTPSDPIALAYRQLEAANKHDLDALMSIYAPDVVYDTSPHGLGVYEGTEAMRALIKEYWDAFEELTFELEELRDLGSGVTFHVVHQRARPVGSTQYVDNHEAHVSEWAEGKVVRVTVYLDPDEGRSAAERLAASRG